MKIIFLLSLLTFSVGAAAADFEGAWTANGQCDYTWDCPYTKIEIEHKVAQGNAGNAMLVRFKDASTLRYDETLNLFAQVSQSRDHDRWATLVVTDAGFEYEFSNIFYGLRDSRGERYGITLKKISESEYHLLIREDRMVGWKYRTYRLSR